MEKHLNLYINKPVYYKYMRIKKELKKHGVFTWEEMITWLIDYYDSHENEKESRGQ